MNTKLYWFGILAACNLPLFPTIANGQKILGLIHEDSIQIVESVTLNTFSFPTANGIENVDRGDAKLTLLDHRSFLPGYIRIKEESSNEWDADVLGNTRGDYFHFRYNAKLISNRSMEKPFILFEWKRADGSSYWETLPLDPIKKGEETLVNRGFWVPNRFKGIKPYARFMVMGFELGTSREISEPMTPYAYMIEQNKGEPLQDGNIKPISIPKLPALEDDQGNAKHGRARLYLGIDELGYVNDLKVKDFDDWSFAKAAIMCAPFFMFEPEIRNGEAVASKVLIPFTF